VKDKMNWFQKKENIRFLLQVMFAAALPWLCAFLHLFLQGKGLGEVWLPGSEWNDELFYYKQVEGMVKEGYPLGYFGFNESLSLYLQFGIIIRSNGGLCHTGKTEREAGASSCFAVCTVCTLCAISFFRNAGDHML